MRPPVIDGIEELDPTGHFGSTCYHPLFVFNQFGDCEGAPLHRHQLTRTRPDIIKWKAGIHAFVLASDILFGLSSRGYDVRRTKLNATPRRT